MSETPVNDSSEVNPDSGKWGNLAESSSVEKLGVGEVISMINTLATEEVVTFGGGKGGVFHGLPDYDGRESPYTPGSSVRVSVYTKDGEPSIYTVSTLFHAQTSSGIDRGTTGYEIHEDGRVVSFTNGEASGKILGDDNPEQSEVNLRRVEEMLVERQKGIDAANKNRTDLPEKYKKKRTIADKVSALLGV